MIERESEETKSDERVIDFRRGEGYNHLNSHYQNVMKRLDEKSITKDLKFVPHI